MADNDLRIIIQTQIDQSTQAITDLNTQIAQLAKKLNTLDLKISIDEKFVSNLSNFINSFNQATQKTNSELTNQVNIVNQETKAIKDATEAQKQWNTEREKTIKDGAGKPTSVTTTYGNDLNNSKQIVNSLPDGSIRKITEDNNFKKDLTDLNKTLDDAYRMNDAFDKRAEALDKAHYQALNEDRAKAEALDKMHYQALQKNRDIDLKSQEQAYKQAESLDRAHFTALKDNNKRIEDMDKLHYLALQKNKDYDIKAQQQSETADKQHYLALQQNQTREEDFLKQKENLQNKIIDTQRRFAGDKTLTGNLDNLLGSTQQINSIGNYKKSIDEVETTLKRYVSTANSARSNSVSFGESLATAFQKFPVWMLATTAFYAPLRALQSGIQYVTELNATLTQISTAVNYNQEKVAALGQEYQKLAVTMGATTAEISKGALEFFRQGLNDDQVLNRLKITTEYAKISGLQFTQSADLLTAASNSMKVDITKVADVFTLLGDKTATSASEIGIAFQKVGATAESLNIPFERVAAMIATVSSVTREAPETIGSAIKSILSRVESVKQKGYDSEDGTTINQVAKALDAARIKLMDANGQFRNFSTVLDELGAKWNSIDDKTQRYIATTVAGTFQQSRFLALMANYNQVLDLNNQALNAAGTTQQKYNLYLEGSQAHLDRLKAVIEGLFSSTIKSDFIKNIADSLIGLVQGITFISEKFGLLPPILFITTTALLLFNTTAMNFVKNIIPNIGNGIDNFSKFIKNVGMDVKALGVSGTFAVGALAELKVALTSLLISTGVGLAIAGLTIGISALLSSMSKAHELQAKVDQQNQTVTTSWNTQKDKVLELIDSYKKLDEQTKGGTVFSDATQQQKYLDVTTELQKLMPNLVASIDQSGKVHLKNADAIDKEISSTKKLAELQNQKDLTTANKDFDKLLQQRKDYQNQLDDVNNNIKSGKSDGGMSSVFGSGSGGHKFSDEELKSFEIQALGIESQIAQSADNIKAKISSLTTTTLQLSGIKLDDNISAGLQKIVASLDVSKISNPAELTARVNQLKSLSTIAQNLKNSSSIGEAAQQEQSFYGLAKAIGITDEAAKSFLAQVLATKNGLNDTNVSTTDLAQTQKTLSDQYSKTYDSVKPLNDAIDKMKQGHQLTSAEISELLKKYPDLITAFKTENGHLVINAQALEEKRKAELAGMDTAIESQKQAVAAQEMALKEKLRMYGLEIDSIKSVADAQKATSEMVNKALSEDPNASDIDKYGAETRARQVGGQLEEILKAKESINALQLAAKSGFSFQDTINTPNPKKSTSDATPFDESEKFKIDEYARANRELDGQLKESEASMSHLKSTTQAYRDELQKQVEIYRQKQSLAHEEAVRLRDDDTSLQKRLDTEKLDQKQRNDLLKQLDSNQNKVSELSKTWLDYDKTISDLNSKSSLSAVDENIKKLGDSTTAFESKIKSLKAAMSTLKTDPSDKIKDQNELVNTYEQEQIQIQKNISALTEQSKTLDQNSEAWAKLQDEITKYKDKSEQVDSEIYSIKEKLATDAVDLMKKALEQQKQAELEAENRRHKQVVDNLDDEIKKEEEATNKKISDLDKLRAAQDYNKNLSKDQEKAQEIQNQINAYSLDTTNEGQSKVIELKQQLKDQQEKIDAEQQKYSDNLIKQDLQDKDKAYKQDIQNQKDAENEKNQNTQNAVVDKYDNMINDDNKWLAIEKQIIEGHVEGIQSNMKSLIDALSAYAESSVGQVGSHVTQLKSLIEQLKSSSSQIGAVSIGKAPDHNIIETMKKNSQNWIDDPLNRNKYEKANQEFGKQIGASYNNGTWFKDGLPLYHDGGEIGVKGTSFNNWLNNLGQDEMAAIVKKSEVMMNNPLQNIADIIAKFTPDFSKIVPKMTTPAENTVNLGGIHIGQIIGDEKGANNALSIITNGLKRMGINPNS